MPVSAELHTPVQSVLIAVGSPLSQPKVAPSTVGLPKHAVHMELMDAVSALTSTCNGLCYTFAACCQPAWFVQSTACVLINTGHTLRELAYSPICWHPFPACQLGPVGPSTHIAVGVPLKPLLQVPVQVAPTCVASQLIVPPSSGTSDATTAGHTAHTGSKCLFSSV